MKPFDWFSVPLTPALEKEKEDARVMTQEWCLYYQLPLVGAGDRVPDPNDPNKMTCGRPRCRKIHDEVPEDEKPVATKLYVYYQHEREHRRKAREEYYEKHPKPDKDPLYEADMQGRGGWRPDGKGTKGKGGGKGGGK